MDAMREIKPINRPAHWLMTWIRHDWGFFLVIFTVLSVIACFPIFLHPTWHLGSLPLADKGTNLWNLWWVYYALFERGCSPLHCDMIFIPWGCDLRYHTLSLANGLLASPMTAILGPSVSFNGLFFFWTLLTGYFATLWARQLGANRSVAILTGVLATFGPYRWSHQIHLNLFSTPWMFLAFYFCERSRVHPRKQYASGITLAWILAFFSDWYYGLFVGLYLAIRSSLKIGKERTRSSVYWILKYGILPSLVTGILLYGYFGSSPTRGGYVDSVDLKYSSYWSLDAMHFVLPLWLLPHFHDLQQSEEFHLHPGLVLMVLPLFLGWVKNPSSDQGTNRKFLFIMTLVFMILSLGPILMWFGVPLKIYGLPIFLPAGILELIPSLTIIRVYARFAYLGWIAYLLLGLLGMQHWFQKKSMPRGSRWGCSFLAILLAIETGWHFPSMYPYAVPSQIYPHSPKSVLEIPFTPSVFGGLHLFHQTLHHQPIFVTEFSRLGHFRKDYLQALPALNMLNRMAQGLEPTEEKPFDPEEFCEELERLGPIYITLSFPTQDNEQIDSIHVKLQSLVESCRKGNREDSRMEFLNE